MQLTSRLRHDACAAIALIQALSSLLSGAQKRDGRRFDREALHGLVLPSLSFPVGIVCSSVIVNCRRRFYRSWPRQVHLAHHDPAFILLIRPLIFQAYGLQSPSVSKSFSPTHCAPTSRPQRHALFLTCTMQLRYHAAPRIRCCPLRKTGRQRLQRVT
jgi:hypothetical protein